MEKDLFELQEKLNYFENFKKTDLYKAASLTNQTQVNRQIFYTGEKIRKLKKKIDKYKKKKPTS